MLGVMERLSFFILLLSALLAAPNDALAGRFQILTNELPPIKTVKDGRPAGMAGGALVAILERVGVSVDTGDARIAPLSQAYEEVRLHPDRVLMGLQRTAEREPHFKWVGPIYTTSLALLARKADKLKLVVGADAAEYKVATVKGSGAENLALKRGVPMSSMTRTLKVEDAASVFIRGEADLIAFPTSPALYSILLQGRNPDEYEVVLEMKTVDIWIAFNSQVDDSFIEQLQRELDQLKTPGPDGTSEYDGIIRANFRSPF